MRYLAGCLSLVALVAAPLLTLFMEPATLPVTGPGVSAGTVLSGAAASVRSVSSFGKSYISNSTYWSIQGGTDFLARLAPVLASVWVLGVTFFSVRLMRSYWCAGKLRTRDHEPVDAGWMESLDDLRCRLGVSRPVRL